MSTKPIDNLKLGIFVMASLAFMILTLYMIGKNRNLFQSTITIRTYFHNVNGLMPGNNVRFSGIDVGTVKDVKLMSDTAVEVSMVIDKRAMVHIKRNSVASVGTDGLMGNKLININSVSAPADPIENNEVIAALKPVETDAMWRTLNTTNENISAITSDLKKITLKINNSNSLWSLLSDTTITRDVRLAANNLRSAGTNISKASDQVVALAGQVAKGEGLAGFVLKDTVFESRLKLALDEIAISTAQLQSATRDLQSMTAGLKDGQGLAGAILSDSALVTDLRQSLKNVEEGTGKFSENMEAMRSHFLFRGYFKKMEKENREE